VFKRGYQTQKQQNKTNYKKTHKQQKQKDKQTTFTYISLSAISFSTRNAPQTDQKTTKQ